MSRESEIADEQRFLSCYYCEGGHSEEDCPDNPDNQPPKDSSKKGAK